MNNLNNIFTKKYVNLYKNKINCLGPLNKIKVESFLISRLVLEIILFILFIFIPKYGIIISIISVILVHIVFTEVLIDSKLRKRNNKLYEETINFYIMLKMALKKTNDLKTSIEIVSHKLNNSIALQFKIIIKNNRYNNDIDEIFNNVIKTISNNDVRATLIDLKESSNYQKTIDKNIELLQDKNILIKQKYQYKPIILFIFAVIILIIIIMIIFNIYSIKDYIIKLFDI